MIAWRNSAESLRRGALPSLASARASSWLRASWTLIALNSPLPWRPASAASLATAACACATATGSTAGAAGWTGAAGAAGAALAALSNRRPPVNCSL